MSKLELSEAGRRYLFLRTELDECPDLANDEEFMRRYHVMHRIYRHYKHHSRQSEHNSSADTLSLIRQASDGGVI